MLALALKSGALLLLLVGVLYLMLRAKRLNFEKFRSVHSRRKYRVLLGPDGKPLLDRPDDQAE